MGLVLGLLVAAGVGLGAGAWTGAFSPWLGPDFDEGGVVPRSFVDFWKGVGSSGTELGEELVAPVTAMFAGGSAGEVLAVPLLGPEPTPSPVSGPWRYVEEDDRLVFPTPGPTATPTPRPTRVVNLRARATLIPTPEARAPEEPWSELQELSCTDFYRGMLVAYSGRVPLGPEVSWQLSGQLVKVRPDCLEKGWRPEFGLGVVCEDIRVGGVRMSDSFIRWEGAKEKRPRVLSTRKDGEGNILVHFERMPLEDAKGCWYYSAFYRTWFWVVLRDERAVSGVDLPVFPSCEKRLGDLIRALALEGGQVNALEVARFIDGVKLEFPEECGGGLWTLFPVDSFHPECPAGRDTGVGYDGAAVVNWHPRYPASDGAVCWVFPAGGSEWKSFYEDEG